MSIDSVIIKTPVELISVNYDNFEEAIKIQNTLFPDDRDEGRQNILSSLNGDLAAKSGSDDFRARYYLAMKDGAYIGITGLYHYGDNTKEAWLGWFGVLSPYRRKGYGRHILELSISLAKQKGYEILRLYTDKENKKLGIYMIKLAL